MKKECEFMSSRSRGCILTQTTTTEVETILLLKILHFSASLKTKSKICKRCRNVLKKDSSEA